MEENIFQHTVCKMSTILTRRPRSLSVIYHPRFEHRKTNPFAPLIQWCGALLSRQSCWMINQEENRMGIIWGNIKKGNINDKMDLVKWTVYADLELQCKHKKRYTAYRMSTTYILHNPSHQCTQITITSHRLTVSLVRHHSPASYNAWRHHRRISNQLMALHVTFCRWADHWTGMSMCEQLL